MRVKRTITLYITPDMLRTIADSLEKKMKMRNTRLGEDVPHTFLIHDTEEFTVYELAIDQDRWNYEMREGKYS